jgi:heme exporter protein B
LSFLKTTLTILGKDLLIEFRLREIILTTALFAFLVVLLAAFAFGLNRIPVEEASAGVLWIAIAFSGVLALGRTFVREREFGVWRALLLAPISRPALYLGKVLGVLVFLFIVELVLLPIIELFFHAPILEHFLTLIPILLLGTIGFAAVGALFAAMTVRTSLRDLLLGIILYPLIAPILIAAVKATEIVLAGEGIGAAADYLQILAVIDAIYVLGGLWLFGPLVDD